MYTLTSPVPSRLLYDMYWLFFSRHEDRWDRGLRHGQGICVFANGERFEGEWLRDHISYQGKGALTLADGTTHDFA